MTPDAPTPTRRRPSAKQAFTATAFGFVTARNAWRLYFRELAAERRERARARR